MKNLLLVISIAANFGLIAFCFLRTPKTHQSVVLSNVSKKSDGIPDYEITSMRNFETVYFNRNDSIYKNVWGEAFENEPEKAFLISCSYYFVTKDTSILKDIGVSVDQIEQSYQRKMKVGD
jgi:hypothetical protein